MKLTLIVIILIVLIFRAVKSLAEIGITFDKCKTWDSKNIDKESSIEWYLKPLPLARMIFSFRFIKFENFRSKSLNKRFNEEN